MTGRRPARNFGIQVAGRRNEGIDRALGYFPHSTIRRCRHHVGTGCAAAVNRAPICYAPRMPWTRKFLQPIALKDGRVIATLDDARVVVRSLPARSQSSDVWLYAGGLMLEAATACGPIRETAAQLRRALKAEGLI
jgi:hypothetical protein